MRIAVTGANGFIGSAVCARLVADGHEVRAIVRREGVAPPDTDECVVDDIAEAASTPETLADQQAVVHLAARVHVLRETATDPSAAFRRVNTEATLRLATRAREAGVTRFVFMSSIAAQGRSGGHGPLSVDQVPVPETPYGISKLEAENGLRELAVPAMAVTALRVPMVYGPGAGGNFDRLVRLVGRGIPLPFGSVDNRRSMLAIWNAADLVAHEVAAPSVGFRLVTAADAEPMSTRELVRAIGNGLGKSAWTLPFPPSLLRVAGRLAGREQDVDRLIGSLEVTTGSTDPSFDWTPPLATTAAIERTVRELSRLDPRR